MIAAKLGATTQLTADTVRHNPFFRFPQRFIHLSLHRAKMCGHAGFLWDFKNYLHSGTLPDHRVCCILSLGFGNFETNTPSIYRMSWCLPTGM